MSAAASPSCKARLALVTLLPIMAAVLAAFLVVGLALPVPLLHVHQGLGLGTLVSALSRVGLAWAQLSSQAPWLCSAPRPSWCTS